MAFELTMPIRFGDIDSFGHVNNTKYLAFCEDCRVALWQDLEALGAPPIMDGGIVVAKLDCTYRSPVTMADREVTVISHVQAVRHASVVFMYEIRASGRLAARLGSTIAFVSPDGRPRPLLDVERAFFEAQLPGDPAELG